MKKQGSIIVEAIASIMILSLTTTFIVSACMQNSKILKERILCEEANRAVANLINEFKYNISSEEIEKMLENGQIGFRYNRDFSTKLLSSNVENLENGEEIWISKVSDEEIGLKLKIVANIRNDEIETSIEKEFTKSWWMDEIQR
ncbi:hypothetical protein [Clostridium chromiireducens]|uniref:Type II secretion system protein n=1 Tax=Clostridium chromiireducens TaxID=225345 RepID=A0A1V4IN29_9CLOT|nr:hypothetical protein [Clostridium chromiireducens]OPJ61451.1 hypothetical protein CLCHR_24310 [Clostridium chromiireducens]RII33310.1 hypothetical protein D2A34_16290 [Clostridium chromiireducens]